jgi:hydroxymethylglutaryl-CoA lyase
MAMGGLGGCPFAQDLLVGNLATETALEALRNCGAALPKLEPLGALSRASQEISRQYGLPIQ